MTSRQQWFKSRVDDCLTELKILNEIKDWEQFKKHAHYLACELLYVTSEWDKYYMDVNKKD